MKSISNSTNKLTIYISFIPLLFLVVSLFFIISIFGDDALSGASQIALLTATAVCAAIALIGYKVPWREFEDAIAKNLGGIGNAIIILLLIGALSGIWMLSGIVPLFIYYGIQIINPHIFLVAACILCAIVSLMTGSSWTTIATVGIALMGIGKAHGFNEGWIAGAIISGAYFGDKMSPLSDTTVLASSMTNTPLFTHIRYMMVTTIPSLLISLLIFSIAGFSIDIAGNDDNIGNYIQLLDSKFNLSPFLLIVPLLTAIMILKKMPAVIVLFLSVVLAAIAALIFQTEILTVISGVADSNSFVAQFKGMITGIYGSTQLEMGSENLNELVATSGMGGMLNTIWLIICAMCFGSAMTASGMLSQITAVFTRYMKKRASIVASTVGSGIVLNCTTADQYLAIILSANMYKKVYSDNGYESRLLSRTIEDSVTVTSALIPWNTCGMTQSTILGISTIAYAPYCFFNIISPLMSILIAGLGYKIYPLKEIEKEEEKN